MKTLTLPTLLLLLAVAAPSRALQADFVETFDAVGAPSGDGAANLIADGWIFRNQSEPLGNSGWSQGPTSLMSPFEGSGYLHVDGNSTGAFGGDLSTWAILPEIPGQVAGDALTVHVQRIFSHSSEVLQVRYSPGGGTSTGSGFAGIGDFDELLVDLPLTSSGWQTVSVPLPGAGRVALRVVIENACLFGCAVPNLGFDLLSVGPAPEPECNQPPLPQPGETVHWPATAQPWEICADLSIPPSATVLIDQGAAVHIEQGHTLTVSGELIASGTESRPVVLDGWGSLFGGGLEVDGSVSLQNVALQTQVHALAGGSVSLSQCSFTGFGLSSEPVLVGPGHGTYLEVDDCTVVGADLRVTDGTLVIRDTDLTDGGVDVLRGYLFVDDVAIDGSALRITRERFTQPAWLDRVSIVNSPVAALDLQGWNFHVGPNAVLQGNQRPAALIGGLLPGSNIPATGNADNSVQAALLVGSSIWGALDVPYVLTGTDTMGGPSLEIEAGATVELGPGAAVIAFGSAAIRARGTEDAPIVFRNRAPGLNWDRLKFQSTSGSTRFEWCEFSGADVALQSDNSVIYADASTFHDNLNGIWTNTSGLFFGRKLRVHDNAVGAHEVSGLIDVEGSTNPSSFVGNGAAIDSGDAHAQLAWWGDPSGPTHAANPGGTGDSAAPGVSVLPFLTAAPDFDDAPPRVDLRPVQSPQLAGSKLILTWDSSDDSVVTGHEIHFAPYGNTNYSLLVGGLSGGVRTFEIDVPAVLPSALNELPHLRVVAIDDAGQLGWDERAVSIPYTDDVATGTFAWLTPPTGAFTFNDSTHVTWDSQGISATFNTSIVSDPDGAGVPYGGAGTQLDGWDYRMPYVSTDRARVWLTYNLGASNRFITHRSPPFEVRPDPRLGDAPPSIAVTSPLPGQSFGAGDVVPVRWTSADDESVREVRLFVSTDGGETWQPLATVDGAAGGYAWRTPGSTGHADVRLLVSAVDLRYQVSSDEVGVELTAGPSSDCAADLGFAGPGHAVLSACGTPLATGGQATLRLQQAPASAAGWLVLATGLNPTPLRAGTLAPLPILATIPFATDANGELAVPLQGGNGPFKLYVQAAITDGTQPAGLAFSNALALQLLP